MNLEKFLSQVTRFLPLSETNNCKTMKLFFVAFVVGAEFLGAAATEESFSCHGVMEFVNDAKVWSPLAKGMKMTWPCEGAFVKGRFESKGRTSPRMNSL